MRILAPEDVKKGSTAAEDELRVRVRDLSAEEERLVASVNALRADEKAEKERIGRDMGEFRAEAGAERDRLSAEVKTLEERRADAMKPVDELRAEADERNRQSKEREDAVAKAENDLAMLKTVFEEYKESSLTAIYDRRQIQDEREEEIAEREEHLRQEEAISKESLDALNAKWADFHTVFAKTDAELTVRENAVVASEKVNATDREQNVAEAARLRDENRAVRDKYAALEQAKAHLGIK